jgi:hypothetical protein
MQITAVCWEGEPITTADQLKKLHLLLTFSTIQLLNSDEQIKQL